MVVVEMAFSGLFVLGEDEPKLMGGVKQQHCLIDFVFIDAGSASRGTCFFV